MRSLLKDKFAMEEKWIQKICGCGRNDGGNGKKRQDAMVTAYKNNGEAGGEKKVKTTKFLLYFNGRLLSQYGARRTVAGLKIS